EMLGLLKQQILNEKNHEITYEQYMNTVLYHPIKGYYIREVEKVGTRGDFITSSNISSVYGKICAQLFIKLIEQNQMSPIICEIGGGTGRFAKAVLDEIQEKSQSVYENLQYIIIEKSPFHLRKQSEILPVGEKTIQFSSLSEAKNVLTNFNGIVFSNELFEAFPVRAVEKREQKMYAVKITLNENQELAEK